MCLLILLTLVRIRWHFITNSCRKPEKCQKSAITFSFHFVLDHNDRVPGRSADEQYSRTMTLNILYNDKENPPAVKWSQESFSYHDIRLWLSWSRSVRKNGPTFLLNVCMECSNQVLNLSVHLLFPPANVTWMFNGKRQCWDVSLKHINNNIGYQSTIKQIINWVVFVTWNKWALNRQNDVCVRLSYKCK